MSHTFTIRLTEPIMTWLKQESERTGIPVGRIIREQIERAMETPGSQPFLRHAGKFTGPANMSSRKGFSRT
ncbi:MAG: ribbon-helix-helix domain-containing protein [Terriglobales bacterium]